MKRSVDSPESAFGKLPAAPPPGIEDGADLQRSDSTRRQLEEELVGVRDGLETTLDDSRERYRALFERSRDLVYLHDFEGHFLDANPAALSALGYDRNEIRALNFHDLLDPADLPKTVATLEELRRTGTQSEVTEYRVRSKGGEWLYLETKASVIFSRGKPHAIQGIARDITERKRVEQALQQSQDSLELAQRVGRIGNFTWNIRTNVNAWSRELEALYGLAPGAFDGTIEAWRALVHPEDLPRAERAIEKLAPRWHLLRGLSRHLARRQHPLAAFARADVPRR